MTLAAKLRRAPGNPRPTQHGIPIAKDVWMLGIGTGLVVDAATSRTKGANAGR